MIDYRKRRLIEASANLEFALVLTLFSFLLPCVANSIAIFLSLKSLLAGLQPHFLPVVFLIMMANTCLFFVFAAVIKNALLAI